MEESNAQALSDRTRSSRAGCPGLLIDGNPRAGGSADAHRDHARAGGSADADRDHPRAGCSADAPGHHAATGGVADPGALAFPGSPDRADRLHRARQRRWAQPSRSRARRSTIQVQWTGGELTNFTNSMADFAKATGITVQIDSVPSSHETVLKSRIEGGSPPDIAQLAQPTPVLTYASEGKVIDVATFMDVKKLTTEHPSTIGLLTQGTHIWGVPYKADVKSTIWYPIKSFAAAGYKVPTTWDELIALSDQIVQPAATRGASAPAVPATRPAGSSRTGSNRSSSRRRASPTTTIGSTTRSRSRTPASRTPSTSTSARSSSPPTTSTAVTRRS